MSLFRTVIVPTTTVPPELQSEFRSLRRRRAFDAGSKVLFFLTGLQILWSAAAWLFGVNRVFGSEWCSGATTAGVDAALATTMVVSIACAVSTARRRRPCCGAWDCHLALNLAAVAASAAFMIHTGLAEAVCAAHAARRRASDLCGANCSSTTPASSCEQLNVDATRALQGLEMATVVVFLLQTLAVAFVVGITHAGRLRLGLGVLVVQGVVGALPWALCFVSVFRPTDDNYDDAGQQRRRIVSDGAAPGLAWLLVSACVLCPAALRTLVVAPDAERARHFLHRARRRRAYVELKVPRIPRGLLRLDPGGKIGAGGEGQVHLGDYAGQKVAAKVLFANLMAPEKLRTLRREAALLAGLRYPNLTQFYGICDAGDGSGVVYLVSELCAEDLCSVLDKARRRPPRPPPFGQGGVWGLDYCRWLTPSCTLLMLQQTANAMRFLHARGIAHRDLKPENIMLHTSPVNKNDLPSVRIIDFGASRFVTQARRQAAHEDEAEVEAHTDGGGDGDGDETKDAAEAEIEDVTGTIQYLSPEALRAYAVPMRIAPLALPVCSRSHGQEHRREHRPGPFPFAATSQEWRCAACQRHLAKNTPDGAKMWGCVHCGSVLCETCATAASPAAAAAAATTATAAGDGHTPVSDSAALSFALDVYSFGVLAAELTQRDRPYEGSGLSHGEIARAVAQDGLRPRLEEGMLERPQPGQVLGFSDAGGLAGLIRSCWAEIEPDGVSSRPSFTSVSDSLDTLLKLQEATRPMNRHAVGMLVVTDTEGGNKVVTAAQAGVVHSAILVQKRADAMMAEFRQEEEKEEEGKEEQRAGAAADGGASVPAADVATPPMSKGGIGRLLTMGSKGGGGGGGASDDGIHAAEEGGSSETAGTGTGTAGEAVVVVVGEEGMDHGEGGGSSTREAESPLIRRSG